MKVVSALLQHRACRFDELRYEIQLARKLSPTGIIGINAMVAATQFAGLVKDCHRRRH